MTRNDTPDSTEKPTMKDVSHTPPDGTEDANRVFERGHEHAEFEEETVEE